MHALLKEIDAIPPRRFSRVARIEGLPVQAKGAAGAVILDGQVMLSGGSGKKISREVVGFREGAALAVPPGNPEAASLAEWADFDGTPALNAFAELQVGLAPLPQGTVAYPHRAQAWASHDRGRIGGSLDRGEHALNTRKTEADVIVICLIGEHGRDPKEFIEDDLGPQDLARSVIVAAPVRRQAADVAMTVTEQLRAQDLHVLLLMDSVTCLAVAQREAGVSAGEPPAQKGHRPTVFAELPRLLDCAGPGLEGSAGSITALFTVLIEGSDHNEPIAEAVRRILDGHIVLERDIAERGRSPEISTSAIRLNPPLEAFPTQKKNGRAAFAESYSAPKKIMGDVKGRVT
jgi:flagellum-specific ATP synthase